MRISASTTCNGPFAELVEGGEPSLYMYLVSKMDSNIFACSAFDLHSKAWLIGNPCLFFAVRPFVHCFLAF